MLPHPDEALVRAGAGPGATPPPSTDLAERILDNTPHLKARASINVVLEGMEQAGARNIPISKELAAAIPVVAAKMMTKQGSLRANHAGAKLAVASLKYNLDRFEEANKTEEQKLEINVEKGVFIIPAPVIGRLGETPKERE